LPETQVPIGAGEAQVSPAIEASDEIVAEPMLPAPSGPAYFTPRQHAEPVTFIAPSAEHDAEGRIEVHPSEETEQQVGSATIDESPVLRAGVEASAPDEALHARQPQSDSPLGPDEDPGDLFEQDAEQPIAPPAESAAFAALAPANVASEAPQILAPPADQSPPILTPTQRVAIAAEPDKAGEVPLRDSSAVVSASSADLGNGPPSKPQAVLPRVAATLPSVPRPAPNDPLAAVRSLSEEEKIALFS
jgi:hypothetical protein